VAAQLRDRVDQGLGIRGLGRNFELRVWERLELTVMVIGALAPWTIMRCWKDSHSSVKDHSRSAKYQTRKVTPGVY